MIEILPSGILILSLNILNSLDGKFLGLHSGVRSVSSNVCLMGRDPALLNKKPYNFHLTIFVANG